jgi:hypothetical protein
MRDAPIVCASPFSSYWRCAYYRRVLHFIVKGGMLLVACLALVQKQDALHTDASLFILPRPVWYGCLVSPHLLELMLTSF